MIFNPIPEFFHSPIPFLSQTTKYINVTLCELCSAPLPSGLSRIRIECADQFRDIPNDSIPKKGDGRNLVQSVQYLARYSSEMS